MQSNQTEIKSKLKKIPAEPGVYLMKDITGEIIYIGKAILLNKRVNSYFNRKQPDPKTAILIKHIHDIEYIITDSEIESLLLENNLIKKHKPRYNIRLKDDKMYPYIAITDNEEYPRIIVTRERPKKNSSYFGPYTDVNAARKTVELLNKIFQLKTCKKKLPLSKNERPCLNYQIKKCKGLCQNKISKAEYHEIIISAKKFLKGEIDSILKELTKKMNNSSEKMEYEKAAEIRNIIFNIQHISENQKMSVPIGTDCDYIGLNNFDDETIIVLFEFRKGILIGRKITIFQNTEYSDNNSIIEYFLINYYSRSEVPEKIITQYKSNSKNTLIKFLNNQSGKKITLTEPVSSNGKGIINLILKNINLLHTGRMSAKITADKMAGLKKLQKILSLGQLPARMVCFDISNFQGKDSVAGMANFVNGEPAKSGYRKFKIRGYDQANDPGMIHEAIARFLQNCINESLPLPELIIIDGGPTQLGSARQAALALDVKINIISIAKKNEELYFHEKKKPIVLPKNSPALRIVQNIRDETHRFGVSYHRKLRDDKKLRSILEEIPTIGPEKRNILLKNFNSIDKIRKADFKKLISLQGITKQNANNIIKYFKKNNYKPDL